MDSAELGDAINMQYYLLSIAKLGGFSSIPRTLINPLSRKDDDGDMVTSIIAGFSAVESLFAVNFVLVIASSFVIHSSNFCLRCFGPLMSFIPLEKRSPTMPCRIGYICICNAIMR